MDMTTTNLLTWMSPVLSIRERALDRAIAADTKLDVLLNYGQRRNAQRRAFTSVVQEVISREPHARAIDGPSERNREEVAEEIACIRLTM